MLGFRGASRYVAKSFRDCFDMECKAMKKVREEMGLTNVQLMVPFVRTVGEGKAVIERLAADGLKQGENGLKVRAFHVTRSCVHARFSSPVRRALCCRTHLPQHRLPSPHSPLSVGTSTLTSI